MDIHGHIITANIVPALEQVAIIRNASLWNDTKHTGCVYRVQLDCPLQQATATKKIVRCTYVIRLEQCYMCILWFMWVVWRNIAT